MSLNFSAVPQNYTTSISPYHAALAPIQNRRIRSFAQNDRSRTLVQIPNRGSIKFGDVIYGLEHRIALPHPCFNWLNENAEGDWFLTTTFLFPAYRSEMLTYCHHPLRNECLVISFAMSEDAFLFKLSSNDARILPTEWWREIEDVEYRRHPKFRSIETSKAGLLRIDGNHIDVGFDRKLPAPAFSRCNKQNVDEMQCLTVEQLTRETWIEEAPDVCNA
jgi:hypothetical protein